MWKSEKGITLIALGITVIIISLLLGASIGTRNIIKTAQDQKIITNMVLIQNKIRIIREKSEFNNNTDLYVGTPYTESQEKTKFNNILTDTEKNGGNIYILSGEDLETLGLKNLNTPPSAIYAVDYKTEEILYSEGIESDGEILYRLSELGGTILSDT